MRIRCVTAITMLALLLVSVPTTWGQSAIQQETNESALQSMSESLHAQHLTKKAEAIEWAQQNNVPVRMVLPDGTIRELMEIRNGRPVYMTTYNLNSAQTISTDDVWPGSGNYTLDGTGLDIGEWDGGEVRVGHDEFGGRATWADDTNPGTSSHSTHVAGTIIAAGVDPTAQGMAHAADLSAYDWDDDAAEMATEASGGMLLSNHSYGYLAGWSGAADYCVDLNGNGVDDPGECRFAWYGTPSISSTEDWLFGFYDNQSNNWDNIARNAPFYLIVVAAANDRNDNGPAAGTAHWVVDGGSVTSSSATRNPDGNYDCIPGGSGVAKNVLTVGAVNDIPGGYTGPGDVVMSTFSSWGPADDGRVKPDIVANGVGLWSADDDADDDYTSKDGTSMAAPSVTGSMALLQELFQDRNGGTSMRSSTLKGLVIHTADSAGASAGPDYSFGWGLMNTHTAADLIDSDAGVGNAIRSVVLADGGSYSFEAGTDGSEPLRVTAVWTDPAGSPTSNQLDPTTKMLVNDLDIRVSHTCAGDEYMPWVLDGANPASVATTGDNNTDNVEQVFIADPEPGVYEIAVTHKGSLSGGSQRFALIVTGAVEGLEIAPEISASATGGSVDDNCEFLVTFDATITDDCEVSTSDVDVNFSLLTGNATLDAPTVNLTQTNASTVDVDGSVLVHSLTGSPATIQVTFEATDDVGEFTSESVTADVVDDTDPVITCAPDMTFECDAVGDFGYPTVTDNCDPEPTITLLARDSVPGACPQEYQIELTYEAEDDAGNTDECTQVITVEDTTPPEITCPTSDELEVEFLNPNQAQVDFEVTATDNCDDDPEITVDSASGSIWEIGLHTVTAVADDGCGNTDTCSFSFQLVYFDIKPTSCPNPLNVRPFIRDSRIGGPIAAGETFGVEIEGMDDKKPNGVLPVAILGTDILDVKDLDPSTITINGVSPLRWAYEDVATPPYTVDTYCGCDDGHADGYTDLTLKFSSEEIIATLGPVSNGDNVPLIITGDDSDGIRFFGGDCVLIKGPRSALVSESEETDSPETAIIGAHPNPFNPVTTISFSLAQAGQFDLTIYNIAGRVVSRFTEMGEAGLNQVTWDASAFSSGVYFYRIQAADFTDTDKMVLIK